MMARPKKRRVLGYYQQLSMPVVVLGGTICWIIFFAAWEAVVLLGLVSELLLPTPQQVIYTLYDLFAHRGFMSHVIDSIVRVILSFTAACVVAIPLGVLMGAFRSMEVLANPFVSAWRYLPAPAFIPILLMWLGTGEGPKLAILFIGVVFFLITLSMDHTKNVRRELIETAMTLGGSRSQILWTIVVRAVLPDIFVAMRQMLAVSWTYLVVAEIVASTTGIGAVMMKARRFLHTDEIMAGIVVIGILGLAFDYLFRAANRWLFPYSTNR